MKICTVNNVVRLYGWRRNHKELCDLSSPVGFGIQFYLSLKKLKKNNTKRNGFYYSLKSGAKMNWSSPISPSLISSSFFVPEKYSIWKKKRIQFFKKERKMLRRKKENGFLGNWNVETSSGWRKKNLQRLPFFVLAGNSLDGGRSELPLIIQLT